MPEGNESLIPMGTMVRTTKEDTRIRHDWSETRAQCRWQSIGGVVGYHRNHRGQYYDVLHDGTIGHYGPTELEVLGVLSDDKKVRGLMQVVERIMAINQEFVSTTNPAVGKRCDQIAMLYEVAKQINRATTEAEFQQALGGL